MGSVSTNVNSSKEFSFKFNAFSQKVTEKVLSSVDENGVFLNSNSCERLDPDSKVLAQRIHAVVLANMRALNIIPTEGEMLYIPVSMLEELSDQAKQLKAISLQHWKRFYDPSPLENSLTEFVRNFNEQYHSVASMRIEAERYLESLNQQVWVYNDGQQRSVVASEVAKARVGFYQIYLCNDPIIKEKALLSLIDLLEWDPLEMSSAYHLVELQKFLLEQVEVSNAQDLNTKLQRLLIKAYALSIECILLHFAANHLNALTDASKMDIWKGAEQLSQLNATEDPEIHFWSQYAIQGAQHIKSDKSDVVKWLERFLLIGRAGTQLVSIYNNPENAVDALSKTFVLIRDAFSYIEWHEDWFKELLIIKKFCRSSLYVPPVFRQVTTMIKQKKMGKNNTYLNHGIVAFMEYTIAISPVREVQEEGVKLLLHYLLIGDAKTKARVIQGLSHLLGAGKDDVKETLYLILKLLEAGKIIPPNKSLGDRNVNEDKLFDNVVKFLLGQIAEVRTSYDLCGQSLITLLCASDEERLILPLLQCLTKLCPSLQKVDSAGRTPYHLLVEQGHYDALRLIHEAMNLNINAVEKMQNRTALHLAVQKKSHDGVETLLTLGADPNIRDIEGNTPLYLSVSKGVKLVQLFVGRGAEVNIRNHLGKTPLKLAIEKDLPQIVSFLVSNNAIVDPNNARITPIVYAAKIHAKGSLGLLLRENEGNLSSLENREVRKVLESIPEAHRASDPFWIAHHQLLDEEAPEAEEVDDYSREEATQIVIPEKDPEEFVYPDIDEQLNRPVHIAALKGDINFFQRNVQLQEEYSVKNRDGQIPLHLAACTRNKEVVSLLVVSKKILYEPDNYGNSPLHIACRCGDQDIVELLYREDLPANDIGNTPLHEASIHGNLKTVQFLLQKGDSIDATNVFGETPLMLAAQEGHPQIVEQLLKVGADLWKQDGVGETAMHKAIFHHHRKAVEELVRYESEHRPPKGYRLVEIQNNKKETPIHLIPKKNPESIEIVTVVMGYLLVSGADPLSKDCNGETFLHKVAYYGRIPMLRIIPKISKQVLAEQKDSEGNTLMHSAAKGNQIAMVPVLKQLGVRIDSTNKSSQSPLLIAAELGFWEMARKLIQWGADPKKADSKGRSLLHLILEKEVIGNEEHSFLVDMVNTYPGLLYEVDENKRTPLHILSANNHYLCLYVLRFLPPEQKYREGYRWLVDKQGKTAARLAEDKGYIEMARKIRTFDDKFLGADYKIRIRKQLKVG